MLSVTLRDWLYSRLTLPTSIVERYNFLLVWDVSQAYTEIPFFVDSETWGVKSGQWGGSIINFLVSGIIVVTWWKHSFL